MDLKHKGISWVGNMFQKFEAVCQEVDSIINQDKVKYVENQVSSASENVKKLCSDVVEGLLPPSPEENEAKAAAQRQPVPINAYFTSPSHSEGKTANDVVNNSSVEHGITDQIGNRSQASCKVTFVNEEVAQVPNRSSLELNADLPLEKKDDVLLDKDLYENMLEKFFNELLSEKNDCTMTDKPALVESDATDPLCHSVRNVSSEIDITNKSASSVCEDSDLQLEDDILLADKDASKSSEEDTTMEFNTSDPLNHMANRTSCQLKVTDGEATLILDSSHLPLKSSRLTGKNDDDTSERASSVCEDFHLQLEDDILLGGNNDGVLTDKVASKSSEEDTTMEFNATDPLKHMANHTSCQVKVTNGEETLILDDSHLPLEFSRLSRKSNNDLSDENSDQFLKKAVIMELNATDQLNNHLSHVWNGTNFVSKEADDSNLLSKSEVLSGRIDHALIDNDFDTSPIKDAIFEDDLNSYLLNLPGHGNGVSLTYEKAFMVSDRNYLQLDPELLARKNDDALTDKYSYESLQKNAILELEHDESYPLKNQPSCTSNSIKYKNEEVSSVSNDSFLKLESEVFCGKNSEDLTDEASDACCKEQSDLKLSNELTLHCDEESIKETLCSCDNECEEDIVTSTGNLQETSIHGVGVESTHEAGQDSSVLVNNLVDLSLRMETTSKNLENGTGCSSNARDALSSEPASPVLTRGETVEETKSVSTLESLPKVFFSASRSLVKNVASSTLVHDKPSDQRASINCESHPSFEVVTSACYGNKAFEMKFASSKSSLSSVKSLGTHASRGNESAFLPKFLTSSSSQVEFPKSTSFGALSFSTEVGFPYNSSGSISDSQMETVDLGHKVTLKDECDVVDYKALHAVSRRAQKLQSYKKRIQDAFTSKKRLAKEYEQLAIWYGDTDMEFSTDSSQKLDTKDVSTSYASDSEWELL